MLIARPNHGRRSAFSTTSHANTAPITAVATECEYGMYSQMNVRDAAHSRCRRRALYSEVVESDPDAAPLPGLIRAAAPEERKGSVA